MSVYVDTTFLPELRHYGAFDINACYNCGNCTAVCPLSTEDESFPRKMIRYGQVGMRDKLLATNELWLCYYCGECSDTCPRQAEPGEFMASARRFAIGRYEVTGLARIFFTSLPLSILILAVIAVILGVVLMSGGGQMSRDDIVLWDYVDNHVAHNLGLGLMAIVFLTGLLGVVRMGTIVSRDYRLRGKSTDADVKKKGAVWNWVPAALKTVFLEVVGHSRYIKCDEDKDQPWFLKRWFVHGSVMWGFLGTGMATLMHWIFMGLNMKDTGEWIPAISIPIRIWGITAGLFLVYGTTVLIVNRLVLKSDKQASNSVPADWIFILLLWFSGITGFVLLIGHYIEPPQMWVYPILLIHATVSMELFVLVPFTKFAHVFYRTVAIFIHELRTRAGSP